MKARVTRALPAAARRHLPLLVLVALAALVRAGFAVAYWPALPNPDGWEYLQSAYTLDNLGASLLRPPGYPLLLAPLTVFGRELAPFTVAQHVVGLATGVLLYALLRRLDLPRWAALAAAAVVLLDAHAIVLEHHILAEAPFTLAVLLAVALTVASRRPWLIALAGLLLVGATSLRYAAVFAVPAWFAYVVWRHGASRQLAAASAALAAPLVVWAVAWGAVSGSVGLSSADGWFLYGRIAQIADCEGVDVPPAARPLCDRTPLDRTGESIFALFDERSAARRAFGEAPDGEGAIEWQTRTNSILREFSFAVLRERPLAYARIVAADFVRFFLPGDERDPTVTVPRGSSRPVASEGRTALFPDYELVERPPAAVAEAYEAVVHTPAGPLGLGVLAAAASILAGALGLLRQPRRRETLLFAGAGCGMLLGVVLTSDWSYRYLLPSVPLLVAATACALADLVPALRARRRVAS